MTDTRVFDEPSRIRGGSGRATALLAFGLVANLATQMTFAATRRETADQCRAPGPGIAPPAPQSARYSVIGRRPTTAAESPIEAHEPRQSQIGAFPTDAISQPRPDRRL